MLRSIAVLQTGNWDHADQGIRFDKTGYLAEVSREIEGITGGWIRLARAGIVGRK
jgi:hypothetical protein